MLLSSAQNYLNFVNSQPLLHTFSPAEARAMRKSTGGKLSASHVKIEDIKIKTRDDASVTVRNYEPLAGGYNATILYIHGGGWVINSIETSHASCLEIVKKTGYRVVSVDYRLAPEYKFPIPVYDCHDAYLWLRKDEAERSKFGSPAVPIFIAGDSAGGNLASAVTQLPFGEHIAGQILLYPVASLTYDSQSYKQFSRGYGLDKSVMEWFGEHYVSSDSERFDARVHLLNAKIEQAPPSFVVVAEYDVLRDEGIEYAEKLALVNGQSQLVIKGGLVHSYFTRNDFFSTEIDVTIDEIAAFVESVR